MYIFPLKTLGVSPGPNHQASSVNYLAEQVQRANLIRAQSSQAYHPKEGMKKNTPPLDTTFVDFFSWDIPVQSNDSNCMITMFIDLFGSRITKSCFRFWQEHSHLPNLRRLDPAIQVRDCKETG